MRNRCELWAFKECAVDDHEIDHCANSLISESRLGDEAALKSIVGERLQFLHILAVIVPRIVCEVIPLLSSISIDLNSSLRQSLRSKNEMLLGG